MTQTTAIQKQSEPGNTGIQLASVNERNSLTKLNMRELRELATVMVDSGAFPDIKTAAQAQIKIIAGAELGFSPIVSMTGIHFFQGKVSLGANLQASLIKDSGKYEYKITEHTDQVCEIAFFQRIGSELKSLGTPVRYTWADAQKAQLIGKDNWKKYPKDMLFAACIRQGARRYCADILRGTVSDHDDIGDAETISTTALDETPENHAVVNGEVVDTGTGEVIEDTDKSAAQAPAESVPLFTGTDDVEEIRESVQELLSLKIGEGADLESYLKGRDPQQMTLDALKKMQGDLAAM